ncbi:VanW family protein [Streptomyces anulatus]|uniref:VanW family protein n=1 Tax=Streptomyces anulatus TaxID=1892 RepID=UPI00225065E5|nr:VanW family protein [Streptomyces anulatus]MCX4523562.1 VanW family protein [Streptomyces anulatus]MCX4606572.1 VanW family protein [Streptomyces anulatus]WTD15204.1 VanW family protein [Streptomyces anulatus]WTE08512.1 VanW family protein [Streptomyces anulatus]
MGAGFGGLYLVGLLVAGDDVPAGTRVSGVDIGGLSNSQARERLDSSLGKAWSEPVKVSLGDSDGTVRVSGISLDTEETVARAAQAGADPFTVIGRLFAKGDREVEPVIRVDETKARASLAEEAKSYDRKAREGAVTFKAGEPVLVRPVTGRSLNVDGAVEKLASEIPGQRTKPVRLPVRTTEPQVGAAEVERAMKEFATPAMSAPVTLTVDGRRIEIGPATVGKHLAMKPDGTKPLTPVLDGKGLLAEPTVASALALDEPANAELRLDGGRVTVASDGKAGQDVTAAALQKAVLQLLTKSGAARTGPVGVKEIEPTLTRDNLGSLGIKEQMSTFTVDFESAPYRVTNIGRAAELINGSVVLPDETWSFNRTVGERTEANGFVEGVIINNDRYEKAAGGGVSAVATTVFNAFFFAGVKPVEYGAHSFYIERYPEGREATVAWGSLDLKFRNDSGNAIYVDARATDTSVTITFLGTKKYDEIESVKGPRTSVKQPATREGASGENCVPQTPLEGFNVAVDRIFKDGGRTVKTENFETRYDPRDEVTCD